MKTILISISILLLISVKTANAQEKKKSFGFNYAQPDIKRQNNIKYKHIISTMPLRCIVNYIGEQKIDFIYLGYENKISERYSIRVNAGVSSDKWPYYNDYSYGDGFIAVTGFRIDAQFKYFTGKHPKVFSGWYFSPILSFKACRYEVNPANFSFGDLHLNQQARSFNTGLVLGYQYPFSSGFIVDFYLGLSNMLSTDNPYRDYNPFDPYSDGVGLMSGISIGYGF